jgi:hypothetical protein
LHVLSQDAPEEISLPGSNGWEVRKAFLLGSGKEIHFRKVGTDPDLVISLSKKDRGPVDTIVVLER